MQAQKPLVPRLKDKWVPVLLALGAALRLLFIFLPHAVDSDGDVYRELGQNLFHHGIYGMSGDDGISPSIFRLPGYPLFLTLHGGSFIAAELTQAFLELLGCWLLYRMVLRERGELAARWMLGLSSLCLFTATYAAAGMTECLSVFCVSLALYALARELREGHTWGWIAVACGGAMLLRPDGALVTFAVVVALGWYGAQRWGWRITAQRLLLVGVCSVLPLVPWTIRNWKTFHTFQPLAPRNVSDPGEFANMGLHRWMRTWTVEFATTGDVYWKVGTEKIEWSYLPARVCDSPEECVWTRELIAEYNINKTAGPELDAKFGELAAQRIASHPLRYYLWIPAARAADMWLRPRTETFEIDSHWWQFAAHPEESVEAVLIGLLGLVYVGLAIAGAARRPPPVAIFCLAYVVMRTLLVGTMENSEPRYTLEAFPILFVCASGVFGSKDR